MQWEIFTHPCPNCSLIKSPLNWWCGWVITPYTKWYTDYFILALIWDGGGGVSLMRLGVIDFKLYPVSCPHDDVIRWKHFPRYWPFVRGIHLSSVNSPPKGQWRGASMFSFICYWISDWVNNREAGDLRHHRAHYDVNVMRSAPAVRNEYFWARIFYKANIVRNERYIIEVGLHYTM